VASVGRNDSKIFIELGLDESRADVDVDLTQRRAPIYPSFSNTIVV
jgi:hypothetical protein